MSELLLIVTIAERRCALRASDVQSVIETGSITPIPRAPAHVTGLSALRSQALTVIDCRSSIGFDPESYGTDLRAPVVSIDGHAYALQVDTVEDISTTSDEATHVAGGFGDAWMRIADGMVETPEGPALVLKVDALVEGQQEPAANAA